MNWLKIFKIDFSSGGRGQSTNPSPPPYPSHKLNPLPKKQPRGRLVPMKDGSYSVQIWQEEYQKFSFIDFTTSIEEGKQKIKDYFEDKDSIINGIIHVY